MAPPASSDREQEALDEMAATELAPVTAWCLSIAFLLAIVSVPLVQAWRAGAPEPPRAAGVLPNAEELRDFEDDLEQASLLREALLPMSQRLLGALGAGNEQAYLGLEGWLFYRPDVEYITGSPFLAPETLRRRRLQATHAGIPEEPNPLPAILSLRERLAERGVQLLVMPTPLKPSLVPAHLSTRYGSQHVPLRNPSFGAFMEALETAGVHVVDVAPALASLQASGTEAFLASDTHWSPEGLEVAARQVALAVRSILAESSLAAANFERTPGQQSGTGDIARMLGFAELATGAQVEVTVQGVRSTSEQLPAAEVLLLGDSFSNIYSLEGLGWGTDAGLRDQLQFELQTPLDSILINDNGSYATRRELARRLRHGSDVLDGKRLVIYQFAERELSQGNWMPFDWKPRKAGGATQASAGSFTATIAAKAHVPRPGSLPYRHMVLSLHLTDVLWDADVSGEDLVLFLWGMRDDILTPAASARVGASIRVDALPWEQVAQRYGSYNRSELQDPSLLDLPLFWANSLEQLDPSDVSPRPTPDQADSDNTPRLSADRSDSIEGLLARSPKASVLRGTDGWLFFRPELEHLAAGRFWGPAAQDACIAEDPRWRDPMPAILDLHEQLKRADIELWVVPVPPKAAVLPEALGLPASSGTRPDEACAEFLRLLQEQGVRVLDLTPHFRERSADGLAAPYCKQDTHWSPSAIEWTAQLLAQELRARPWYETVDRQTYEREESTVEIAGDLWRGLGDPSLEREALALRVVLASDQPVEPWRESPVLLLGDSHTLVFHAGGDMLASGAGLPDQLAFELGFPVDLIGVRGSASSAARMSLFRRRDQLAGKRVVLWVFSARELTHSRDGWRPIPLMRK